MKIKLFIYGFLLCTVYFSSCASQINGVLRQGGSADLHIQAAMEPRMTMFIRSLRTVMGNTGPDYILDGPSIGRSIADSPGVQSVSLQNSGPGAINGNITVNKIEDFLSLTSGRRFITYSESTSAGRPAGTMHIYLDRETAPELIALLSAEAVEYLSALMAPAVLGEDISKEEYLALVSSLYGRPIAGEINESMIRAQIDFPGAITSIRGGTANGNRAVFTVPLLDLLVLETPISLEANW